MSASLSDELLCFRPEAQMLAWHAASVASGLHTRARQILQQCGVACRG